MATARKKIRRTSTTPSGFIYRPDFISPHEEDELLAQIRRLRFETAMFRGYSAKRRIAQFGLEYSFDSREATPGTALPAFLLPLRVRVTELVPEAVPERFVGAIVTEYPPGAAIGWHRDVPQFGIVYGVSLAAACRMRLRLPSKEEYEIVSLDLEPRSAYIFQGEARWKWQHSIPPVTQSRYSITFRTLRQET